MKVDLHQDVSSPTAMSRATAAGALCRPRPPRREGKKTKKCSTASSEIASTIPSTATPRLTFQSMALLQCLGMQNLVEL